MAFALQSWQNHGLGKFAPLLRALLPYASAKYPYAPAAAQRHQVLPALTRSLTANKEKKEILLILKIRLTAWPF